MRFKILFFYVFAGIFAVKAEGIRNYPRWFSRDYREIQSSPCKTKILPSTQEMENLIDKKVRGTLFSDAEINGVKFENESSVLLDVFKNFTTSMNWMGKSPLPEEQKNFQEEFQINPQCKKVRCAMETIWGKKISLKMIYIILKHQFNTSEYAFSSSSGFIDQELDSVLLSLEDLPPHFIPLGKKNQRLTNFYKEENSIGMNANATIILFSNWGRTSFYERQYIVFHELSHNISEQLDDMAKSPSWLNLSGWIKKGDAWTSARDACFVSEYAAENPEEDYAESLANYRYSSSRFKKRCPQKYALIKKEVFEGLEYETSERCSPLLPQQLTSSTDKLFSKINILGNVLKISTDNKIIQQLCGREYSFNAEDSALRSCLQKMIKNSLINDETSWREMGLPKDAKNKNRIIYDVALKIAQSDHPQVNDALKNIQLHMNTYIDDLVPKVASSYPVELPSAFENKCGHYFWESALPNIKECAAKILIEDEGNHHYMDAPSPLFPDISIPAHFSKKAKNSILSRREELFTYTVKTTQLLDEPLRKALSTVKRHLLNHFEAVSISLKANKLPWKEQKPSEFCDNFYLKPTIHIKYYLDEKNELQALKNSCEELQKKKRVILSREDIAKWVEHLMVKI